jgi:hypothetical protein
MSDGSVATTGACPAGSDIGLWLIHFSTFGMLDRDLYAEISRILPPIQLALNGEQPAGAGSIFLPDEAQAQARELGGWSLVGLSIWPISGENLSNL